MRPGRRDAVACGVLALATAVFAAPLLSHDALPNGADASFALQAARAFGDALREGVLAPRWVGSLNRGLGGPVFVFYPPIAYYATTAASLVTSDWIAAFRWVWIVGGFLSGASFLLAVRPRTSEWGALAGAALYVLLPYHLIDVYDRFALAQFLAFIWLPPLFRCTRDLAEGPSGGRWLGLVASYAGLILTHLPTAFLVPLTLGPFALVLVARSGAWLRLAPIVGAGVVALLCCAFYLIPMLAERDLIHSEWIVESLWGDWRRNFVFSDEVALGYTRARIKPWVERALLGTAALAGVAAVLLALRQRTASDAAPSGGWSPAFEAWTYVGLALWAIVLQTPLSTPLWAFVPELGSVQFPWRYGVQLTLFACLAVSCSLAPLEPHERLRGALGGLTPARQGGLALGLVALTAIPALLTSAALPGLRSWDMDSVRAAQWGRGGREYVPAGSWFPPRDAPILPEAVLLDGGSVRVEAWTTHARRVSVESPGGTRVRLRTFAYPGWEARLDGAPVALERTEGLGTLEVAIPPGRHRLEVRFASTPTRRRAAALSLTALLLVAAGSALTRYRKRRS